MVHPLAGYEGWMTGSLVYPDAFGASTRLGSEAEQMSAGRAGSAKLTG